VIKLDSNKLMRCLTVLSTFCCTSAVACCSALPLSSSSIIWYRPMSGDALQLGSQPQFWRRTGHALCYKTRGRSQGGRAQPRKLSAPAGFGTVGLTWGSLHGAPPPCGEDVADPLEIRLSPRFSCRIWSF